MDAQEDDYASDLEAEPEEPSEGDLPQGHHEGEGAALGGSAEASNSSPADPASGGAP